MDVARQIRGYIQQELLVDPGQHVEVDEPLLDGLLDSAELMHVATFLEETFGITVEPSDMSPENFGTIRDLERFVESKRSSSDDVA